MHDATVLPFHAFLKPAMTLPDAITVNETTHAVATNDTSSMMVSSRSEARPASSWSVRQAISFPREMNVADITPNSQNNPNHRAEYRPPAHLYAMFKPVLETVVRQVMPSD
jgi:hypothetical protein